MTHHKLKSWPQYFAFQTKGDLEMTIRFNDRNYQIDDSVQFLEWEPEKGYTGRVTDVYRIKYLLKKSKGLMPGYVVLILDGPWSLTVDVR